MNLIQYSFLRIINYLDEWQFYGITTLFNYFPSYSVHDQFQLDNVMQCECSLVFCCFSSREFSFLHFAGNPFPKWFEHFLQMQKSCNFPTVLLVQPPSMYGVIQCMYCPSYVTNKDFIPRVRISCHILRKTFSESTLPDRVYTLKKRLHVYNP
jgi:hypothetical protein